MRHVQIFENRGAFDGRQQSASALPDLGECHGAQLIPRRELKSLQEYRGEKKSCLLCDYLQLELKRSERVVCQNEAFAVVVPFWAVWPFETLVLSKRHFGALQRPVQWGTRCTGGYSSAHHDTLRPPVSNGVSLFDGLSSAADGWRGASRSGIFTRTIFRRCCAPRRCRNSWSVTKCSGRRSGTSRRKPRRSGWQRRKNAS